MIRLSILACLLAAVAAQTTYYCGSSGPGSISESDFFFVTRRGPGDFSYPAGLVCDLNLFARNGIMLDIQSFDVLSAVLTVTEGSKTLFRGSSISKYQFSIAATSGYMRIRFDSSGDYSYSRGITMRIRVFDNNRCPPGWTYLYNNCFGTSNTTGRLNYMDAQKACNSMGANLLHMPSGYFGSVGSFMRMLPNHLRQSYTWIGLTDRSTRFTHVWLNRVRQYESIEISCVSGGLYTTCYTNERCGTFNGKNHLYAIYMDTCTDSDDYACSMPPGGSGIFYPVPNEGGSIVIPDYTAYYSIEPGIIWGSVVGSMFVVGLIVVGIYTCVRSSYVQRTSGATSVVVSTGRVVVASPPTVPFSVQNNVMQPSNSLPYPTPPPPPYNMVVAAGYSNGGYHQ